MPHCKICYKENNKERENAKNAKDEDEFSLATQHGAHSRSICKWIMHSKVTKHITLHNVAFDTYEINSPRRVRFGDDSVAKAIGMRIHRCQS